MDAWIPYLKDPLILAGFVTFLLARLTARLLASDKLQKLTRAAGTRVLERALLALSLIAILVVILGFALRFYELSKGKGFSAVVDERLNETEVAIREESKQTRDFIQDVIKEYTRLPTPEEAEKIIAADLSRRLDAERNLFMKASTRYKEGLRLYQMGQNESARKEFLQAVEEVPDFIGALIALGRVQVELGEDDLARRAYQRAVEFSIAQDDSFNHADSLLRLAELEVDSDPDLARTYTEMAKPIVTRLNNIELSVRLHILNRQPKGEFRNRLFWLVDMIYLLKLHSNHPMLVAQAESMENALGVLGEFMQYGATLSFREKAHIEFLEVLKLSCGDNTPVFREPSAWDIGIPARLLVLNALFDLGKPNELFKRVEAAQARLDLEMFEQCWNLNRINSLEYLKNFKEMLEQTARKPISSDHIATEKEIVERIRELETTYSNLILAAPQRASLWLLRGYYRFLRWDIEDAMQDFNKAIALDRMYRVAYYFRALVSVVLNDIHGAYLDYNQALKLESPWLPELQTAEKLRRAERKKDLRALLYRLRVEYPDNLPILVYSIYNTETNVEFARLVTEARTVARWRPDATARIEGVIAFVSERMQAEIETKPPSGR